MGWMKKITNNKKKTLINLQKNWKGELEITNYKEIYIYIFIHVF